MWPKLEGSPVVGAHGLQHPAWGVHVVPVQHAVGQHETEQLVDSHEHDIAGFIVGRDIFAQ